MEVRMLPRRARISLSESDRHISWQHALAKPGLGFGVELLLLAVFAVGGSLERRLTPVPSDEHVSFLAPLKEYAPPPAEERFNWVGLGGPFQSQSGESEPPVDDGTRPVSVNTTGGAPSDSELPPQEAVESERAMSEIEVDSTAALDPTAEGPQYPADLLKAGVEGVVYARFIVDSTGYADTLTFKTIDKADPLFVSAVKAALPRMKYRPAVYSGRRVSQLVEQAFAFRIRPPQGQ